jgi:hypothetical protein
MDSKIEMIGLDLGWCLKRQDRRYSLFIRKEKVGPVNQTLSLEGRLGPWHGCTPREGEAEGAAHGRLAGVIEREATAAHTSVVRSWGRATLQDPVGGGYPGVDDSYLLCCTKANKYLNKVHSSIQYTAKLILEFAWSVLWVYAPQYFIHGKDIIFILLAGVREWYYNCFAI